MKKYIQTNISKGPHLSISPIDSTKHVKNSTRAKYWLNSFTCTVTLSTVHASFNDSTCTLEVGGGQGGLNLPLPVPFNPGSRPEFLGSRPFAFFRLRNIAQCCIIFPFFSRFPPPFLPVSRPPVRPHLEASKL